MGVLNFTRPMVLVDLFPQDLVGFGVGAFRAFTEGISHLIRRSVLSLLDGDDIFVIGGFGARLGIQVGFLVFVPLSLSVVSCSRSIPCCSVLSSCTWV